MEDTAAITPGSTLGVFGGGQLGRMFALAAREMGYRVAVFAPEPDCPAAHVADQHFQNTYDDADALGRFADVVDVVTIEFENIPVAALQLAAEHVPVRPGAEVLRTIQNRLDEKTFLSSHGFPVASFHAIRQLSNLQHAEGHLPGVLKTAASGYDGKGQRFVHSLADLESAWSELGQVECVLESFVEFDCEFSVIVARNQFGCVHYEPILNDHQNHILDLSVCPSGLTGKAPQDAVEIACGVGEALQYHGVLCVEYFLRTDGQVVINEIAPRPHNSGHLTIESHVTSQFQQQVRAICGLPLGSTVQKQPAAMANLLGDVWSHGEPDWSKSLAIPGVALHLYGKDSPRPGRKMGHLTCTASSAAIAADQARAAREALRRANR